MPQVCRLAVGSRSNGLPRPLKTVVSEVAPALTMEPPFVTGIYRSPGEYEPDPPVERPRRAKSTFRTLPLHVRALLGTDERIDFMYLRRLSGPCESTCVNTDLFVFVRPLRQYRRTYLSVSDIPSPETELILLQLPGLSLLLQRFREKSLPEHLRVLLEHYQPAPYRLLFGFGEHGVRIREILEHTHAWRSGTGHRQWDHGSVPPRRWGDRAFGPAKDDYPSTS